MSFNKRLAFESLESRRLLAKDLAIVDVTLTNAVGEVTGQTPVIGEKVYARVHYRITDLTPGDTYNIRWTMDGVSTEQQGFVGFAGTNVDLFWYHGGWIATAGSHSVSITVDSGNTVAEANEGNNTASSASFNSLSPTGSLPNKFIMPVAGTQNVDYVIGGYVDVDPRYFFESPTDFFHDYQGNTTTTRDFHNGIDIGIANFAAQDAGVNVRAAAAGTVIEVRDGYFDRETFLQFDDPGNYVFIDHGNGWVSQYYHFRRDSITVNVGDVVTAGQVLGLVGSSGNSGGPHVHFEVQHNKSPVDIYAAPSDYWVSPPPYVFDPALTHNPIVFGVTNDFYDGVHTFGGPPYEHFLEQVSGVDHFTAGQEIYAYVTFPSVKAGDTWKAQLYRPNGTLVVDFSPGVFPEDRPTDGGWYRPGFTENIPGTWRVDFLYNDVKVAEKNFTVGAGAPEIRVFDAHLTNDNTYIIDGRTTPIDFGNVDFGDTAPTKTFTVENHGYADLTTIAVLPVGYVFDEPLSGTIAAGASDTFTVRMLTSSVGKKAGEITIFTNDASEGTFNFKVEGLVDGNDADFDNDGDVDGRDFLAWQRGNGISSGAVKAQGDATGEGAVNAADLSVWQTEYGTPPALVAAVQAEDETTSGLLGFYTTAQESETDAGLIIESPVLSVALVDSALSLPVSLRANDFGGDIAVSRSADDNDADDLDAAFDELESLI